jgi:hypothetical protein
MAGTRRIPINRPPRNLLSQRAVNLFRLAQSYDPNHRDEVFANINIELHRELNLRPWDENILDIDADDEVPAYLKDQYRIERWRYVRDLRRQLVSMT